MDIMPARHRGAAATKAFERMTMMRAKPCSAETSCSSERTLLAAVGRTLSSVSDVGMALRPRRGRGEVFNLMT